MRKSSKIDLAQKRLELKIEKQEYLILKDLLRLKHKYHPVNVGANFMLNLLNNEEEKEDPLTDDGENEKPNSQRNFLQNFRSGPSAKRKRQFKGIFANLLLIADSYIDLLAYRLEQKAAAIKRSNTDEPHSEEK